MKWRQLTSHNTTLEKLGTGLSWFHFFNRLQYKQYRNILHLLKNLGSYINPFIILVCISKHDYFPLLIVTFCLTMIHVCLLFYRTPLHLACVQGHTKVVQELLEWGGKTSVGDNQAKTPLMKVGLSTNCSTFYN